MLPKREKKEKRNWSRALQNNGYMLKLIWQASPGVVILNFLIAAMSAVDNFLLNTYMFQYALNALQEGRTLRVILITLAGILIYTILTRSLQLLLRSYFHLRGPKVDAHIKNLIHKKATEVELACFERSSFYDTYVKATNEATNRAYRVLDNLTAVLFLVITITSIGTLVISIEPLFLIPAFLPLLFTLAVGKKRNRMRHDYDMETREKERQRDYVRRTFYLQDFSKEMRLTGMWQVMFARMHSSILDMKAIVKKYGFKMMLFRYAYDLLFQLAVESSSIILAAYRTLVSKTMLLGDCFVVIHSISQIAGNINHMGDVFLALDENSLYIDNLRDFLEYDVQIPEVATAPEAPPLETLTLKNLCFRYDGQAADTLHDLNLTIHAGEKIAIVGHNGAGKTTLIKLLQRLYDPSRGEILLNRRNIRDYRLSSYRNLFGAVFQDYQLFAGTVGENVLLRGVTSEADRQTVEEALERSGIAEKIRNLPLGIDSVVTKEFDEDGVQLSGGEAQKLSIARIFAGNQEIVIMDEPTSALDPLAEAEMYRNMFDTCQGKTVIFISHRLSSATMADRIYLFEQGEIVEEGTHHQLLSLGRKYADMWHKQADAYVNG